MEQTVSALLAAAAVGGFAVTAVTCWLLIPALHRLHFGQTIREEGPTWHNKKNGTPTRASPFGSNAWHHAATPSADARRGTWMVTTRHAHRNPRLAKFPLVAGLTVVCIIRRTFLRVPLSGSAKAHCRYVKRRRTKTARPAKHVAGS